MINSISSSSNYWYTTQAKHEHNAVNPLLEAATATDDTKTSAVSQTEAETSSDSSDSSDSQSSGLSMEDLMWMMQGSRKLNSSTTSDSSSSNEDETAKGDISSIDADGDGTISMDEYDSLMSQMGISDAESSEDFFTQFDANGDGEITSTEMDTKAMKGPMMPPPPKPENSTDEVTAESSTSEEDYLLSSIDTDGDGSISTDEYDALISQLGITDTDGADELFSEYDTDGDGKITSTEMNATNVNQTMMPPPKKEDMTLSSDIDTDGDGSLSTDEYESLISNLGTTDAASTNEFFSKYDTNGDGEITADEIAAAKESTGSSNTEKTSSKFEALTASILRAYENSSMNLLAQKESNINSIV